MKRTFVTAACVALAVFGQAASAPGQDASGRLHFEPAGATAGARFGAHATGLAPATRYAIVWHSGDAHWRTESGKFYGIVAPDAARVIAHATSDASGAFDAQLTVPEDFGYLHDVEVQPESGAPAAQPVATQGFTVIPKIEIAPRSGPPGTPITVTVTGLGYRFYQVVWHLLYDGAQTGWLSAVTTHGTARIVIPASGAIGAHTLQAIEGPTAPYLNGQQSPNAQRYIPQVIAQTFRITDGPAVAWPAAAAQTPARLPAPVAAPAATPQLRSDYASGAAGSPLAVTGAGFPAQTPVVLTWETYVGNRLSGNGWSTEERPFAQTVSDAAGGFVYRAPTPDDLGGPHRIIARTSSGATASAAYAIVPSVAEIEPRVVAPGADYTIRIKGVGWTETANTYTIDLDNGNIGYGCGFNSQGDVTMHLRAPGQVGRHYIDLYPTIYTGQISGPGSPPSGASVNGIYFLLPMLNGADHPAEHLPIFHLTFDVK